MEAARKSFINLENSSKLRRVLRERVYERANAKYYSGDIVYYKRNNKKGPWNGPATVVGHLENQVLLKHGGSLIRIHPCKIILKKLADSQVEEDNQIENSSPVISKTIPQRLIKDNNEESQSSDDSDSDSEFVGDKTPVAEPEEISSVQSNLEGVTQHREIQQAGTDQAESWENVNNTKSKKACLKTSDVVRFRRCESDGWTEALVVSRAGKVGGKHQNTFNMNIDGEEAAIQINTDEVEVEKLKNVSENPDLSVQETLFTQDEEEVVFYGTCLPDEEKVLKAKKDELNKFQEYNVYKEVKNNGQSTVSCRWVITKKGDSVKARLVARGFEELLNEQVDAPTVSSSSLWTLFTVVASNSWKIESFDITSAFLQSQNIEREVFINPPPDARKQGIIWKLIKPMYGLGDSARQWYTTLKSHLIKSGCLMSRLDKSVFRWYDDKKKLAGILVTHVDDVMYAGNTKFKQMVIRTLFDTFKISRQDSGCFTYLGLDIDQNQETGVITVNQENYANGIKPVNIIPVTRRKETDSDLSEDEKAKFQSILGKLLWLSGRTRPDLSYNTMELSTFAKSPKIKDLLLLNKIVKKIGDKPSRLFFRPLNLKTDGIKIVFYSDAGLGNLPNGNSSRGYINFLINQQGVADVLSWSSNKIKRVVHSAFAAETLGCNDAVSDAIYMRQLISEILYNDPKSRVLPIYGFVDNMQLFEQVTSSKQSQDKRIRLDIAEIQECVQSNDIENILWIPTQDMLADCLTKRNADSMKLTQVLETGQIKELDNLQ